MAEVSEAEARARRIPAYALLRAAVAQDADAAVLLVDQARKAGTLDLLVFNVAQVADARPGDPRQMVAARPRAAARPPRRARRVHHGGQLPRRSALLVDHGRAPRLRVRASGSSSWACCQWSPSGP